MNFPSAGRHLGFGARWRGHTVFIVWHGLKYPVCWQAPTTAQKKLDFAVRKNNFEVVDQAITTRALLGDWLTQTKKLLKWHKLGRIVKSRSRRSDRGFGARSPKWRLVNNWVMADRRKQKNYSKVKNFWSEERSDEWRK